MLNAVILLGGLAVVAGLLFGLASRRHDKPPPGADQIDAILPQMQCRRCGYSACRPYAQAIARGEADINQCPPGGDAGVRALAELLGRKPKPLNPNHGAVSEEQTVAWIDEAACIGCTRCIQACPVDAILGASKQMHTVIRIECTGCGLCVAPCPVDCIHMVPVAEGASISALGDNGHGSGPQTRALEQRRYNADIARERYEHRTARLARERDERQRRQQRKKAMPRRDLDSIDKKAVIQAAVDRARRRQAAMASGRSASSTLRSE